MKSTTSSLLLSLCLATLSPVVGFSAPGLIPVSRNTPLGDLPALARISMVSAINAALAVAPGKVIEAKLIVESGSLQYNVVIVGANRALFDADIDAGDGRVLLLEKDGEEVNLEAPLAPKK
jgi:hypothetical protein